MTTSGEAPRVTRERLGHVLRIGLNRADKRNAFDIPMIQGLSEALEELDAAPDLRAGVIFAHGAAFSGGLDLPSVAPAMAAGNPADILPEGAIDPWGAMGRRVSKPVVCAVHGVCYTTGVELMLASDVTVAASNTIFGQQEVSRGLFPFGGGTWRWPAAVGWGNAMRYLLTGDTLDAAEALRIGLVQEVAEPERSLARATEIAERI
ncbi:MAG: crotonase/enoyl-CoA hydratase family protein, partial [Candidatus Methylomirabilis sp.]|nr:crotonase/enoyl-CoA hydratase family protein [Deltaproteobacteria bacterium]